MACLITDLPLCESNISYPFRVNHKTVDCIRHSEFCSTPPSAFVDDLKHPSERSDTPPRLFTDLSVFFLSFFFLLLSSSPLFGERTSFDRMAGQGSLAWMDSSQRAVDSGWNNDPRPQMTRGAYLMLSPMPCRVGSVCACAFWRRGACVRLQSNETKMRSLLKSGGKEERTRRCTRIVDNTSVSPASKTARIVFR